MKINYDPRLYKQIAQFEVNDIVQVRNRVSDLSTIHIQNITKLTWHELQLLVSNGSDRFTKMVLLYKKYAGVTEDEEEEYYCSFRGEHLSQAEIDEITRYIEIFKQYNFSKHYEVNEFITLHGMWGQFPTIRSLNDHGSYKEIEGIQPKYFEIVCHLLNISGEFGLPLDSYKSY